MLEPCSEFTGDIIWLLALIYRDCLFHVPSFICLFLELTIFDTSSVLVYLAYLVHLKRLRKECVKKVL